MFSTMWGFTSKNKIKTALLLFSVLCLVLLTNLQERRLINRINESVTSIYEDRVVVGNYILTLSNHTEEIIQLLSADIHDKTDKIDVILLEINKINVLYEKTFLTEKERNSFQIFKLFCQEIADNNTHSTVQKALKTSLEAEKTLMILSAIQVEEGKTKLDEVLRITDTSSILSYIEIIFIILICILIQALVFSAKPLLHKNSFGKQHLN